MNTTASYHSETSWSRRCSTETVFSVQGKETDFVQDSSDTELWSDDKDQYEPVTETDEEAPISFDSSAESENETDIKSVCVVGAGDDDLQLADSEAGSYVSDSELDLPAYWTCARCHAANDNTRYQFCHKCFKIRKGFFPPRPKRKEKRLTGSQPSAGMSSSQDSGLESLNSQGDGTSKTDSEVIEERKRTSNLDIRAKKRARVSSDIEDNLKSPPAPLVKMNSDPGVTIESLECEKSDSKEMCIVCLESPKTGVFVHRRVAHICCCYRCAVRVWASARRCPLCNCKVSNVLRAVIM